jgi:hypothetical protein
MTIPLSPLEDTIVPDTLITPEELAAKAALTHPAFVPLDGKVTLLEFSHFLSLLFSSWSVALSTHNFITNYNLQLVSYPYRRLKKGRTTWV